MRIGIVWAFTTIDYFSWQRTLLSHMLDCQIFGVTPAGQPRCKHPAPRSRFDSGVFDFSPFDQALSGAA
jgi:hypothetical protein